MGVNLGTAYGEIEIGTEGAQKSISSLSQSLTQTGQALTAGLSLPLIGAAGAAIKFSNDFNEGMANVASLGVASDRVVELKDNIQQMAVETGQTTDDLSGGLYQVVSAFGDTADTASILEINAKAAAAGLASTTEAINLTSAVTKGYGDTSAEAVQKAADLAQQTVILGQTTFPELAGSVGKVVPLMASLGGSQEELFATMATATGVTGNAAEVSTQLRGVLQSLMAPTADMTALMNSMGYETGAAMLQGEGLQGVIQAVADKAEDSGDPLQKYIGSIEGQTLALALAGPQGDIYAEKLKAMGDASGTSAEAFLAQTQGINASGFSMKQLGIQASVIMQKLGDGLAPALGIVLDQLKPLADGAIALADGFANLAPDMQMMVVAGFGLAAALGPVMMALPAIGTAVAALASPLGLAVLAVTALGVAWATNFGGIQTLVTNAWTAIQPVLQGLYDLIVLQAEPMGDWSYWWEQMTATLGEPAATAIADTAGFLVDLKAAFTNLVEILADAGAGSIEAEEALRLFPAVLQPVIDGVLKLWMNGAALAATLGAFLKPAFEAVVGAIVNLPETLSTLATNAKTLWDNFVGLAGNIGQTLKPAFDGVVAAVLNLPETMSALAINAKTLWDNFLGLAGTIGQTLKPAFEGIVTSIGTLPATVSTLATNAGTLWGQFTALAAVVGAFFAPSMERVGTAVAGLPAALTPLLPKLQEMGAAFGGLVTSLAPFVALIGGALAIAAAFGVNALAAVIANLPGIVGPIIDQVTASIKLISTVLTEVVTAVKAIINGDWSTVWASAKTIAEAFVTFYRGTITRLTTLTTTVFKAIYDAVVNTLTDLGVDVGPILDGIKSAWETAWNTIKDALAPVKTAVEGVQDAIEGFSSWIGGITFANPFQPLADAANTAMSAAGQFFGGGGGNAVGTNYAKGGLTMVGERGPEAVVLPTGSRVLTNGQTNNMGGQSGPTINVNLGGVTVNKDMDIQRIGWGLANQIAAALG